MHKPGRGARVALQDEGFLLFALLFSLNKLKISSNGDVGHSDAYQRLLLCFLLRVWCVAWIRFYVQKDITCDRRKVYALIYTVWFVFFPPGPCKGHSHVNTMIYRRCKTVKLIRKPLNSSNKQSRLP